MYTNQGYDTYQNYTDIQNYHQNYDEYQENDLLYEEQENYDYPPNSQYDYFYNEPFYIYDINSKYDLIFSHLIFFCSLFFLEVFTFCLFIILKNRIYDSNIEYLSKIHKLFKNIIIYNAIAHVFVLGAAIGLIFWLHKMFFKISVFINLDVLFYMISFLFVYSFIKFNLLVFILQAKKDCEITATIYNKQTDDTIILRKKKKKLENSLLKSRDSSDEDVGRSKSSIKIINNIFKIHLFCGFLAIFSLSLLFIFMKYTNHIPVIWILFFMIFAFILPFRLISFIGIVDIIDEKYFECIVWFLFHYHQKIDIETDQNSFSKDCFIVLLIIISAFMSKLGYWYYDVRLNFSKIC